MKIAGISLLVLLIIGAIGYLSFCPCGPVPGAWLFGDTAAEDIEDWSFVNDRAAVPLCQLQVNTWRPHSINLNCMSAKSQLYVSCSNCADKTWSQDALTHPKAQIRAGSTVYPVNLERITDAALLDEVWSARLEKISREASPRPDHWRSFRGVSR